MLHDLFALELLKLRRSRALLLALAIPLMVVLVNALMLVRRVPLAAIDAAHWLHFWSGVSMQWSYPILPLYIALITALLNGQEHSHHGWRLILTLPVSQLQLFCVKALLAWLAALAGTLVVAAGAAVSVLAMGAFGASLEGAFAFAILPLAAKVALAVLPVVAIQHALSWRLRSLAAPLALGVVATVAINPVAASPWWILYPWAYPAAAMGRHPEALMLAGGVGLALFGVSAVLLARREVDA